LITLRVDELGIGGFYRVATAVFNVEQSDLPQRFMTLVEIHAAAEWLWPAPIGGR
jgi:hypothetical protein